MMINIPGTDLTASSIGLGTVKTGVTYEKADSLISLFLSLGGNLIDTARVYSDWIPLWPLYKTRSTRTLQEKYGATLTQVLLGYFRTIPFTCIPLFGPRDESQLTDAMKTEEIPFSIDDYSSVV